MVDRPDRPPWQAFQLEQVVAMAAAGAWVLFFFCVFLFLFDDGVGWGGVGC